MNDELREAYQRAEATGQPVTISNIVVCDFCGEDYSKRDDPGGILFQSKAACPQCAPGIRRDAERHGELHYMRAVAHPCQPFREFVLGLRNGPRTVQVKHFLP